MIKKSKILISLSIFLMLATSSFSFAQDAIRIVAGSVSGDGLDLLTVYISNSNPRSLELVAKYGEDYSFELTSNTISFNDAGRGTATLSTISRSGETFQYRLVDKKGVLLPSEIYSFTSVPVPNSSGGYSDYRSYPVSNTSTNPNSPSYTTSSTPIPKDPNTSTTTSNSNSTTTSANPNAVTLGGNSPSLPPSSASSSASTSNSTSNNTNDGKGLVPCDNTPDDKGVIAKPCDFNAFMKLINTVIHFVLFSLAIPIAAIMFFYAGFLMVTSGGSAEAKSKAKNIFSNAVYGLVIAAGAWLIIRTILSILGYNGSWIGFTI
ncbi:MAG: pilin [Patescibacteria group bacterium]